MLALSIPGSATSIWVQRAYGTVSTTTLSVLRLSRWTRCVYGRPVIVGADYAANGQHGLVLGLVGTVGSLVDARSTAGVLPTGRLLRRRWIRRGRRSRLRSLLLRRHVDEVDEDLARVNAGSGSHNLDAPYLARQRCRGFLAPRAPMGTEPLLGSAGGGGRAKSGSRGGTRGVLPSFGALRRDNTPTAALWIVLSSCSGALGATVHTSS